MDANSIAFIIVGLLQPLVVKYLPGKDWVTVGISLALAAAISIAALVISGQAFKLDVHSAASVGELVAAGWALGQLSYRALSERKPSLVK